MVTLFIFKSNSRGTQYGIGTYIRELTGALLKYTDINLVLVSYKNSEAKEFSIETVSPRYSEIKVPAPIHTPIQENLFEKRYAAAVVNLLSGFMPANGETVFQMNYIDDLPIIEKLKETYTCPVISVVHFAQWQQLFLANKQRLKGLNIDDPANNIEFTLSREREMYRLSDHIVSVTRYMKDFLVGGYGIDPDKIAVVPNGLDTSGYKKTTQEEKLKLKRDLGFGADEKIIVFSGRVDPCKGIYFLIDAFMEACKSRDNLRLAVIGQGDIQGCLKRTGPYFGKITYTGFIPSDKLVDFYRIADAGVVPSIYDHCPYTVLEMVAHGIPLILSRIDGLNELLDDNQCLFVDPVFSAEGELSFNVKEIAEAILSVTGDGARAKSLAGDYARLMRARFSPRRFAGDMYGVLKNVCVPVEH